jgi:hypothetical protein
MLNKCPKNLTVVAASKEQGSKMMSHKNSTSRYPTTHIENSKFPMFCLLALVGIKFLFFLLFLIFFLNQGHKRVNSTKYQLKPMKDVIGTNSRACGKTGAGTS